MSYELPDRQYDALEPTIDAQIMEFHHSVYRQAYVAGTNAALDELSGMRQSGAKVKHVKRDRLKSTTRRHSTTSGSLSPCSRNFLYYRAPTTVCLPLKTKRRQ